MKSDVSLNRIKMNLENKTIILTGAARIGKKVAEDLKNKGANLVVTYLDNADEVGSLGLAIKADVSVEKDVRRVVESAMEKFGKIEGLVHMAAIYQKSDWENLNEKSWNKNINVIAKSSFLFGKILGDQMLKNEGDIKGKMIFFSDWSVLARPYKDYLPYNVAKSAVVGLTKSLAKELAPHVLVNAIAPGPILRPKDLSEEENKEVMEKTLLKRWGGPEEISKGVLYLLKADFVTGHVLTIDGGRTIA